MTMLFLKYYTWSLSVIYRGKKLLHLGKLYLIPIILANKKCFDMSLQTPINWKGKVTDITLTVIQRFLVVSSFQFKLCYIHNNYMDQDFIFKTLFDPFKYISFIYFIYIILYILSYIYIYFIYSFIYFYISFKYISWKCP